MQLGAVLRCDMVDSTELLAANGAAAAIDARRRCSEMVDEACASGQVIDTRGDGTVIWFPSVSAAVASGWTLQQRIAKVADFDLRVAVSTHEDAFPALAGESAGHSQRLESVCPSGGLVVDGRTRTTLSVVPGVAFRALEADVYQVEEFPQRWKPTGGASLKLGALLFSESSGEAGLDISRDAVVAHGGHVLDTNGAGHMAVFSSCRQAVDAALQMHAESASLNLRADNPASLSFCVGVSMGDVTVTAQDDGFGLAVVEAARLLDVAEPTQTLISSDVATLADLAPSMVLRRGPMLLKGLVHPVDVVGVVPETVVCPLIPLAPALQYEHRFPMVGRHAELARIERRWAQVLDGAGTSVLVSGEEGVGKTRLVREFALNAHRAGAVVLHGACQEESGMPYAAVGAALAQAVAMDPALQLASEGAGPLSVVLSSQTAQPAPVVGGEAQRYESGDQSDLFDEVSEAFGRLAVQRPIVLIIDDVQWAEPDTLGLLRHIVAAAQHDRVVVLTTCRSEQLPDTQATEVLGESGAVLRAEHIALNRLSPDQVVTLLESQTAHELRGDEVELAAKIAEITGGSPLYIEELLVHLVETSVLVRSADTWALTVETDNVPIPASMLDLVGRRAKRLGESAGRVLAIAAMIGATFDVEVLADAAELSFDEILDIVDEAEEAQLLRAVEPGQIYNFGDELSRSAFLNEVRPSRRARLHQRIGESLERIHPNHIDQLANQWLAAAGSEARAKAVHYLRLAGERDLAAAAWESAADRQRTVLELLQADDTRDIDMLGEVHLAFGAALRLAGDEAHRQELMTAADLARQARNGDRLFRCGAAMMRPGAWYPEAGVVDGDIVAICEDSLMLLADDDPLRMHVMAAIATNLAYDHDHERRTKLVNEAQALAKATGDPYLIGKMYAAELTSSHEPERFVRRREIAEEVRRIGRATGDKSLLITGSLFVLLDDIGNGKRPIEQSTIDELTSLVESNGEYFTQYLAAYVSNALAVARFDPDMEDRIEQVRVRFENHPLDTFGMALLQNGCIAMARGTLSALLLEIVKASTTWDEGWGAKWNYALSCAHLDAGDEASALAVIKAKPFPDRDFYWLPSMCQLALLGMSLKLTDVCERVIREVTPFRGRFAVVGLGIAVSQQVSTALGQAHEGLGQIEQAEELYRESITQADELGYPYFATESRRHLAQVLLAQDPADDEAPTLLSQVVALAQTHGFIEELERANGLLSPISR